MGGTPALVIIPAAGVGEPAATLASTGSILHLGDVVDPAAIDRRLVGSAVSAMAGAAAFAGTVWDDTCAVSIAIPPPAGPTTPIVPVPAAGTGLMPLCFLQAAHMGLPDHLSGAEQHRAFLGNPGQKFSLSLRAQALDQQIGLVGRLWISPPACQNRVWLHKAASAFHSPAITWRLSNGTFSR